MFKVRFHLAKGKNFRKWQIKSKSEVSYYDPDEVQLILTNCILRNHPKTAKQIFDGSNKTVCAWIECLDYAVLNQICMINEQNILQYNPRIMPCWRNVDNQNMDNHDFKKIVSSGRHLYFAQ